MEIEYEMEARGLKGLQGGSFLAMKLPDKLLLICIGATREYIGDIIGIGGAHIREDDKR